MSKFSMAKSLILISFLFFLESTHALSCIPCWSHGCSPTPNCQYGLVKDVCGCCDVCANGPGSPCNGPFNINGKCGAGLRCDAPQSEHGDGLYLEGTCVPDKQQKKPLKAEEKVPVAKGGSGLPFRPLPLALRQPVLLPQDQPKVKVQLEDYKMPSRPLVFGGKPTNYFRAHQGTTAVQPSRRLYYY